MSCGASYVQQGGSVRFVLGRSHGRDRTYVRGEEPWDALPSRLSDCGLCADTKHPTDNYIESGRADLGGEYWRGI